ncbi:N-acetylgalactosamine-6-sulfatase [Oceaniferula spumae]|uniref:N-acetylgalactosamine-6-sulfatase n=1 Tax=Oceaniferula spumae TaxID=2979115 RepID=A0AAT9FGN8_9BACT
MFDLKSICIQLVVIATMVTASASAADKPNIVYIMVDDAGIGDFSNYGGKHIKTPVMDRMAKEGMQFNQAYSGNAVCGPTRCVLMTGLHPGHALRRANQSKHGLLPTPKGTVTVASMLKKAGYATGGFGKWGLGNEGTSGVPENQGFDLWYGYYDQKHAHNYYPEFLVQNSKKVMLPKNANGKKGDYTHYLVVEQTLKFIEDHKDEPFFCYAAWTPPHGSFVIPTDDPSLKHYEDKPWGQTIKNYAGMVSLLDQGVGQILAKLKELGIEENTLVIYTSDNGANGQFIKPLQSTGGLRGKKRSLYEGGIRAPMVARWPGKIKAGTKSDLLTSHVDLMATAADIAKTEAPAKTDGISILPTLLGKDQKQQHKFLYFEIYEGAFQQCVRMGQWKGYRRGTKDPLEIYDLSKDPSESENIAADHPDIAKEIDAIMTAEHTPSPHYTTPEHAKMGKAKKKKKEKAAK